MSRNTLEQSSVAVNNCVLFGSGLLPKGSAAGGLFVSPALISKKRLAFPQHYLAELSGRIHRVLPPLKLGAYMYITVFDLLSMRFPKWSCISPANRAVIIGPLIVAVLLLLGGTAIVTQYHYVPLMILGVFCGAVTAKVLGKFLAPQIQSHLTVFLGGVTTVNIGSSGAGLRKVITATADQIAKLVALIPASAGDISGATTLGLWVALLTALVILAANAYFANQSSSRVGNRIDAAPAVAPSIAGQA